MSDKCHDCGTYGDLGGIGARSMVTAVLLCDECIDKPDPRDTTIATLRRDVERMRAVVDEARDVVDVLPKSARQGNAVGALVKALATLDGGGGK